MPQKNDRAVPTDLAISDSLSGAFYFPGAPVKLSGAGSMGSGAGSGAGPCLEPIGSTIVLSGGSALASACSGLVGSVSGGSVVPVQ
jgi:hypothetical protein